MEGKRKEITVSIITIGDELLIGQKIDTNSAWMAGALNNAGFWVGRRVAVADDASEIEHALTEEHKSADIVLMTGGLGPTDDDRTKEVLCDYFQTELVLNKEVLEHVKNRVSQFDNTLLERNKDQALVPQKAQILFNESGTAPGLWFEEKDTVFVAMPGIPIEMKELMKKKVIPGLLNKFRTSAIVHRHWVLTGVPESALAEELSSYERSLPMHISLAYIPEKPLLKLRLTAKGDEKQKIAHELDQYGPSLENKIRKYLLITGDLPIQCYIGEKLNQKKWSLATAESCTGGYIAHLVTSVPGSSDYFKGAVVSYNNEIKHALLGVSNKTLSEKGAVSEEVVRAMLKGVLEKLKADVGIAVSGIMGPGGGTAQKPRGLVWMAAGSHQHIITRRLQLRDDRIRNIIQTGNYGLLLLLDALKNIEK